MTQDKALRFAFDLGTSSVGWAVYELDQARKPAALLGCGARIFPDGRESSAEGKTGESRTKRRRDMRGARRRRDRFIGRRTCLLSLLVQYGLLPTDKAQGGALFSLDPYIIRNDALTQLVNQHHFGRALIHLNQRRGFKSNRKTDKKDDKETGKIASGAKALRAKLAQGNFETLGAYYFHQRAAGAPVRVRMRMEGEGSKASYDFYPLRALVEAEFDLLWERQSAFHVQQGRAFPDQEARDKIREAIFYQRPLRPVSPGRCTFYPDEDRLPKAHLAMQEWLILETVNKIRLEETRGQLARPLTPAEHKKIVTHLMEGRELTWKTFRTKLKLDNGVHVNLEEGGEPKKLLGNAVINGLLGVRKIGPFKAHWEDYTSTLKDTIVEKLREEEDTETLVAWLMENAKLDEAQAVAAAALSLPDGYGKLGRTAVMALLPHLRDGAIYSEAMKQAGLHHSDLRDGEMFDVLPKYNTIHELQRHLGAGTGNPDDKNDDIRYGRVANPSVHIGLNQLRHVVNALVQQYGRPDQIVLELARDLKQSKKQKEETTKQNRINRAANEQRRKELLQSGHIQKGDRKIREKLIRMRLWEELGPAGDRRCPYSGDQIGLGTLLSDAIEIEHILPRSRTLDDSLANKTVAFRSMNRLKRNLSPAQAADLHSTIINKKEMQTRVNALPPNKRWRFQDNAMERFANSDGFLDRHLNETRHFSRLARAYLMKLAPRDPASGEMSVWVINGRLTAEFRRKWRLHLPGHNQKTRHDLRHHALDACTIGVIDRGMVKKIADVAARDEKNDALPAVLKDIPDPYDDFAKQVNEKIAETIISHRPNHSIAGQLHEETNYGLLQDNQENRQRKELDIGNVVRRKPVEELTVKEIGQVRDPDIRAALAQLLYEVTQDFPDAKEVKKQLPIALKQWTQDSSLPLSLRGTRRVRVLKSESDVVPIKDRQTGQPYRYVVPGDNHHMDIIELPNGRWRGEAVTTFAMHQKDARQQGKDFMPWRANYPDATFIMRLHKTDMIQLFDEDGVNRIKRVVRLVPSSQQIYLVNHLETGNLQKRHDDRDDPFRWDMAGIPKLKQRRARRVHVNPIGRVYPVAQGKK